MVCLSVIVSVFSFDNLSIIRVRVKLSLACHWPSEVLAKVLYVFHCVCFFNMGLNHMAAMLSSQGLKTFVVLH